MNWMCYSVLDRCVMSVVTMNEGNGACQRVKLLKSSTAKLITDTQDKDGVWYLICAKVNCLNQCSLLCAAPQCPCYIKPKCVRNVLQRLEAILIDAQGCIYSAWSLTILATYLIALVSIRAETKNEWDWTKWWFIRGNKDSSNHEAQVEKSRAVCGWEAEAVEPRVGDFITVSLKNTNVKLMVALEDSSEDQKAIRLHSLGTRNFCTQFFTSPYCI